MFFRVIENALVRFRKCNCVFFIIINNNKVLFNHPLPSRTHTYPPDHKLFVSYPRPCLPPPVLTLGLHYTDIPTYVFPLPLQIP